MFHINKTINILIVLSCCLWHISVHSGRRTVKKKTGDNASKSMLPHEEGRVQSEEDPTPSQSQDMPSVPTGTPTEIPSMSVITQLKTEPQEESMY